MPTNTSTEVVQLIASLLYLIKKKNRGLALENLDSNLAYTDTYHQQKRKNMHKRAFQLSDPNRISYNSGLSTCNITVSYTKWYSWDVFYGTLPIYSIGGQYLDMHVKHNKKKSGLSTPFQGLPGEKEIIF